MANWFLGGALLVNADRAFDPVVHYYRQFGSEPTATANTFVEVALDGRDAKYGSGLTRFSNFLELIQGLTAVAARGYAVVVNHGMSDPNDQPLGLMLDLTAQKSPWRVDEYVLGLLDGLIGKQPTDADLRKLEQGSRIGATNTPLPPGTLHALHDALTQLRAKQLERLEIRACNLGGNLTVMRLLRRVLGVTDTLSAPDVHMFYGPGALPNAGAMAAPDFRHWQQAHRRARVFTDATGRKPGSYALQIDGHHSQRTFSSAATAVDLSWFVEQNVCTGHYVPPPPAARLIPAFNVAGMDVGASFVLPLESAYRAHIVAV